MYRRHDALIDRLSEKEGMLQVAVKIRHRGAPGRKVSDIDMAGDSIMYKKKKKKLHLDI